MLNFNFKNDTPSPQLAHKIFYNPQCWFQKIIKLYLINVFWVRQHFVNLAKLGDGLAENPIVMVGDNNNKTENSVKIGAY